MNNEKYIVITNSSDGVNIKQVTKEVLLKSITPDANGYHDYGSEKLEFLNYIPDDNNGYLDMTDDSIIIIKGDFVVPKEKQIVVQYVL